MTAKKTKRAAPTASAQAGYVACLTDIVKWLRRMSAERLAGTNELANYGNLACRIEAVEWNKGATK